jgi:2-keto-4-pentenoate hydratase
VDAIDARLASALTVQLRAWRATLLAGAERVGWKLGTGEHHVDSVRSAAALLGAVGVRLQAGDRLITGSIVQVPIGPGDHVLADLGELGSVELTIDRERRPPAARR